jgi:ADP-heptose:LPS heptosyltransferase
MDASSVEVQAGSQCAAFKDRLVNLGYEFASSIKEKDSHRNAFLRKNGRLFFLKMDRNCLPAFAGEKEWNDAAGRLFSSSVPVLIPKVEELVSVGEYDGIVLEHIEGEELAQINPSIDIGKTAQFVDELAAVAVFLDKQENPLNDDDRKSERKMQDSLWGGIKGWSENLHKQGLISEFQKSKFREIYLSLKEGLEVGFQHGDFSPSNLRLNEEGELFLTDSEFGGQFFYPKGYDLAHCFHKLWAVYGRPDLARKMLNKYLEKSNNTREELIKMIAPSLVYRALAGVKDFHSGGEKGFAKHKEFLQLVTAERWGKLFVEQTTMEKQSWHEVVEKEKSLSVFEGRWELEGSDQREITEAIRHSFFEGDEVYISLSDKLGDNVQIAAFLKGLAQARDNYGAKSKINLLVPSYHLRQLFRPLSEELDLEIIASGRGQGVDHACSLISEKNEKDCLVIDLEHFDGQATFAGKYSHDGTVVLRDIFYHLNARYKNREAGKFRYAMFVEDLLGLKRESINASESLPRLPMPENAEAIYRRMVDDHGIDPEKKQIAICLEAGNVGRMYDRWEEVVDQFIAELGEDAEINIIYNPHKAPDEPTQVNEQRWKKFVKDKQGVRLVTGSLEEISVFLGNQAVVVSSDSGLAHIAGAIEGGPKEISLYIPPQTSPNVWDTNPERMFGIESPLPEENQPFPKGGILCSDPNEKRINKIPPESIVRKAESLMRTAVEAPTATFSRIKSIKILFKEIVGREPNYEELQDFRTSELSVQEMGNFLRNTKAAREHQIDKLYLQIMGRHADKSGLNTYAPMLLKGKSDEIIKILSRSNEAIGKWQQALDQNRRKGVNLIYNAILERDVDPDGVRAYAEGSMSASDIVNSLLRSFEFKQAF